MNKSINRLRISILPAIAIVSMAILFTSCLKTDNPGNSQQVSGIMAFNLAPDKGGVGFGLSGNVFTNQPVAYSNFTGSYVSIFPGSASVDAYDYNSGNKFATSPVATFEAGKYYSAFLVGKDSTFENIVVKDEIDSLPILTGQAYIRYINAVANSSMPSVKITSGGTEVVNTSSAFKTVSAFVPIAAGNISVTIANEFSTINASRTFAVEANNIYTILLIGKAGSTDGSDIVQVKYITNGTIAP